MVMMASRENLSRETEIVDMACEAMSTLSESRAGLWEATSLQPMAVAVSLKGTAVIATLDEKKVSVKFAVSVKCQ